jgi:hypothetical protein
VALHDVVEQRDLARGIAVGRAVLVGGTPSHLG